MRNLSLKIQCCFWFIDIIFLFFMIRLRDWASFFVVNIRQDGSRSSSGSIVCDYGLDDRAIGVRSPAKAAVSSSDLCVHTDSGAHPASYPMGTGSLFPGGKTRLGLDADHAPSSRAEIKNE
jgi:hypothetical protein